MDETCIVVRPAMWIEIGSSAAEEMDQMRNNFMIPSDPDLSATVYFNDSPGVYYNGGYLGTTGLDISVGFYTMTYESAIGLLEVGVASISTEDRCYLNVFSYDPEEWPYDAVVAIDRGGSFDYLGFYESDGKMMMDYFGDQGFYDTLTRYAHFEP